MGAETKTWHLSEKYTRSINTAQWNCRATNLTWPRSAGNPKANPSPQHSTWVTNPVQRPDWQSLAHNRASFEQAKMLQRQPCSNNNRNCESTLPFPGIFWFIPENHTWEATQFFLRRLMATQDIQESTMTDVGWNMKLWWRKNWGKTRACTYVFQEFWWGGSTEARLPLNCCPTQDSIKWTSNKYLASQLQQGLYWNLSFNCIPLDQ